MNCVNYGTFSRKYYSSSMDVLMIDEMRSARHHIDLLELKRMINTIPYKKEYKKGL